MSLTNFEAVTYYCETPRLVPVTVLDTALRHLREQHRLEGSPRLAQFLLPSLEFVEGLAKHIANQGHGVVLEVGAGIGALADFLSQQKVLVNCEVRAVDSAGFLERLVNPRPIVEQTDYREALTKFCPDCVICAFMLPHWDWAEKFIRSGVREYILIGFEDNVQCVCGAPESWKPRAGYERRDLEELAKYTACYLGGGIRPQVVSFYRPV